MTGRAQRLVVAVAALCLGGVAALGASTVPATAVTRTAPGRVSPIVLPPSPRSVRAAHAHPAHQRLRCERCHAGASQSQRAGDVLAPAEVSCRPCHDADLDRTAGDRTRCTTCHFEGPTGAFRAPARTAPRLRFSHRVHAREGVRCLECHRGITRDRDVPGARHLPSMRACFECHGGPSPTAPSACATCHRTLPNGLLRTRYEEGPLLPPAWLHGMQHDADFITRHRWVGADQGELCAQCHEESECADCHDGRVRPSRRIHPNDYVTIHAQMARRNDPECTSCHSTQTFCAECHARLGISQMSAPDVRAAARYHPPPEIWTRGPAQHGHEARRSMTTCTSCHSEQDCVGCHGVLGVGAGISPHPPDFLSRCGTFLRTNERPCRLCHGDVEALRAACP